MPTERVLAPVSSRLHEVKSDNILTMRLQEIGLRTTLLRKWRFEGAFHGSCGVMSVLSALRNRAVFFLNCVVPFRIFDTRFQTEMENKRLRG